MPELSKKDKLRLLEIMLESRHADLREQNLNRQGKGHFHVSGMGHEALAAISVQMEPDDYIVPFYRDRGLVLGRGMTTRQLALEYFAKRKTGSGGRMMPSHYSDVERHIWSVPTPTGSQLLPGCGMAWGIQLDGKRNVVVTTVGDAATRQGDFFEAICFAKEKKLPVLFLVEDNAYGISMPTRKRTRSRLIFSSRTTGGRSKDKTSSRFTMRRPRGSRKFAPGTDRSFSGLRWNACRVTPVPTIRSCTGVLRNCSTWISPMP